MNGGVDWKKVLRQLGPVIALGLGILSQVFAHHTVAFAPKAVALLVLGWALATGIGGWLPEPKPNEPHEKRRRFLRAAASTITVGLFRNVLFFLVPVWFASATLSSVNILPPLFLAGLAIFACFPEAFRARTLDRPRGRVFWCSVVLFAALVPAAAVETSASPRVSAAIAAALAMAVASVVTSRRAIATSRGRRELVFSALLAGAGCAAIAPVLPPVPVACRAAAAGTGLRDHELDGVATRFPAGTKRVYAWFAVHLPPRYRQGIRFAWYRDGRPAGHVMSREIVGGREQGFRTASSTSAPQAGTWHVDLLTDAEQLIARTSFTVE
jgi:hypothetical protein